MPDEEEEEIIEGDKIIGEESEYSPKSDFSKGEIVKEAVKKCFELRAKEMRSGYTNSKMDKFGNTTQEWIGDARITFIASVEGLKCLLSPEIKVDGNNEVFEEIIKEMKTCFDKYAYEERLKTEKENVDAFSNNIVWVKSDRKFIPEKDSSVFIIHAKNKGNVVPGGWNNYIHAYWEEMLVIYDKLFSELNKLCARGSYFKPRGGHG